MQPLVGQNKNLIRNIVIVGGGTAGWLSANYLNKALNGSSNNSCNISLIESLNIPTVGVGEATLPTWRNTLLTLGISELDWMSKCQATFKLSIKFANWSGLPKHAVFWHPLGNIWSHASGFRMPLSQFWYCRCLAGESGPFAESIFPNVGLCRYKKAPKTLHQGDFNGQVMYSYHFDAGLVTLYLKEKAKSKGVKHIIDNVVDVSLDHRGFIDYLVTEKSGKLFGDLFIDCSGFRGLLINKALREPFVSYSDSLLCDHAIAMAVPYESEVGDINPYTTATALSSGWAWNVPLVERSGNGYVYSRAFISHEEAEQEFRRHIGKDSKKLEVRHIKMRVGRTRCAWVKNCVSIGLSSGFIEPLEATGIFLIEAGLEHLIHNFPDKYFHPPIINNYNRIMREYFEEIRDFIVLHYCLTSREDTAFWRTYKNLSNIPESLNNKLEYWNVMLPNNTRSIGRIWADDSYTCILSGMGYLPKKNLPILDYHDYKVSDGIFQKIKKETDQMTRSLPSHKDFLEHLDEIIALQKGMKRIDKLRHRILEIFNRSDQKQKRSETEQFLVQS